MIIEYQIVGNYYAYSTEIKLGFGAFGNVYLAKDLRSNEQVALKKIKKDRNNLQVIQIEVDILRDVNNGNVIKLIDDFDTPNHKILILELCDQNLRKYLGKVGRVNEKIALRFFLEIVNGLQGLHEIGYCHRDIKPDNILLKDGQIKIIDVNIAKKIKQDQKTKSIVGTRQYMAPEVKNNYSPYKADIYSLGIVFYEILYGLQDLNKPRVFHYQYDQVFVNDRIVNLLKNMLNQDFNVRWDWQQVSSELNNIYESINQPVQREAQSSIIQNCSNYYNEKWQESVDFLKLIIKNIAIQQFKDLDPYPCALLLIKLIIQKTEQKIITLLKQGLYEESLKYKTELNNQLIQYRKTFLNETKKKKDQLVRIVLNECNYLTENKKEIEEEFQYIEQSKYFTFLYQFFIAELFQKIQSLNENRLSYKILQVQLLIAFDYYNDYENVQRQLILNNLIKNIRISKILQNFNFNNEVAEKYIIALKPLLEQREID